MSTEKRYTEDFFQSPLSEEELELAQNIAAFRLPNGNRFIFSSAGQHGDNFHGSGVAILTKRDTPSLLTIPDLRQASPAEIFHAVANPNFSTPEFLRVEPYGTNQPKEKGWARNHFLTDVSVPPEGGGGAAPCSDEEFSQFQQSIEAYGQNLPLGFFSQSDGPSSEPSHWKPMSGFSAGRFELNGRVNDVTGMVFSVMYCEQEEESPEFGTQNIFRYRRTGGDWQSIFVPGMPQGLDVFSAGDSWLFIWRFTESNLPVTTTPGEKIDFSLRLTQAIGIDKFHLGGRWAKSEGTI
jgi:hypothetical protein